MMDYAIWKPEHDGHAPPNWREGMVWGFEDTPPEMCHADPNWFVDVTYLVPAEALNSPNDDAPEVENGLPPLAKLVGWLGDYTTEELAKHGITLAPEGDDPRNQILTGGMTLRDYFAAAALQGICSTLNVAGEVKYTLIAEDAYKIADAMIAKRSTTNDQD